MLSTATECFVRYIPFQVVKEFIDTIGGCPEEWDTYTLEEKKDWLAEVCMDGDWEYDAHFMSDYEVTKKYVDEVGEVLNTHEEWLKRWAQPNNKNAVYYEVYDYQVAYENEDDLEEQDWDINYWGKGSIDESGWLVSEELVNFTDG